MSFWNLGVANQLLLITAFLALLAECLISFWESRKSRPR